MRNVYALGTICAVSVLAVVSPAADVSKPGPDARRIAQLVRQLGSASFQEREQATQALIAIGSPALEQLKSALQSLDAEVVRRATVCIAGIEKTLPVRAPEGVVLITLPAETILLRRISAKPAPRVRLECGRTIIEAPSLFLGDERAAVEFKPSGLSDMVIRPGVTLGRATYRLAAMAPGSLYIIAPGLVFEHGEEKK